MSSTATRREHKKTAPQMKVNRSTVSRLPVNRSMGQRAAGNAGSLTQATKSTLARPSPGDSHDVSSWMTHVQPARPGDNHTIQRFLLSLQGYPSDSEFQSQLDEPGYDSVNRLIIKHGHDIVAHVRLTWRELRMGELVLPMVTLADLAVLPELSDVGCATALIAAAERAIESSGAGVCMMRTNAPQLFAGRGWFVGPADCYSVGGARDILAYLRGDRIPEANDNSTSAVHVRTWRQVERSALIRLFSQDTAGRFGSTVRDDAFWQWLIGRRAFDRIYVAIDGPDDFELSDSLRQIVGYAILRDNRIVELVDVTVSKNVSQELLIRAATDAIEHNGQEIRYDGPPDSRMHAVFQGAGGVHHHSTQDQTCITVMRLSNLDSLLAQQAESLARRIPLGLSVPLELGIQLGDQRKTLVLNRRSAKLVSGKSSRSYIHCRQSTFSQMLLGQINVAEAIKSQRVVASTRLAGNLACALFPQQHWWLSQFDELPA